LLKLIRTLAADAADNMPTGHAARLAVPDVCLCAPIFIAPLRCSRARLAIIEWHVSCLDIFASEIGDLDRRVSMLSAQNIVGASQCFEQWHYATCHNYSTTDYRRTTQGPFTGHISAWSFGALSVSKLSSSTSESRIEVLRGSAEIRGDPRDHYVLFLVYCGEVGFAQNGRSARLQNGDMVIYDQARPFMMEFGADTRQIIVTIPRPLMVSRLPEVEHFTARRIAAASKLGALTATVVRQLVEFETSLDEDVANRVGASALDILTTTLEAELSGDAEAEGRHHARLMQVKRYVAANLHDPEMTVESIAAAQNLAPRTLHRLFSAEGTTPIRWLWQQRLSASYKALAEGHVRHVTDAALSFGFSDLSHFSRAFKKAFGLAPHTLVRR
jgi:AraC-like DNA-binding protein